MNRCRLGRHEKTCCCILWENKVADQLLRTHAVVYEGRHMIQYFYATNVKSIKYNFLMYQNCIFELFQDMICISSENGL